MDTKRIIHLRKEAEKAVAEMSDGDLKLKAFEVIMNHLLSQEIAAPSKGPSSAKQAKAGDDKSTTSNDSAAGRILVLKDEGFFKTLRSIGEIREELKTHGWPYATTALSGVLQSLAQKRKLRRIKEGNKPYKYSNP